MERFPIHLNGRPILNGRPPCLVYVGKELIARLFGIYVNLQV